MSSRLDGSVVIITGAAGGIGESISRECRREGARMVLVDRSERVSELAADLGDAKAVVGDVRSDSVITDAISKAVHSYGRLSGLVNGAGVTPSGSRVVQMRGEDWDMQISLFLTAPFRWCREAIPVMLEAGGGSIVNISSIEGSRAGPGGAAYGAAKAGLIALTRQIAVEHGRDGLRSNAISPGSMQTRLSGDFFTDHPEVLTQVVDLNYRGRLGEPREIATLCCYLLSDDASFCNGADFVVDGGRLAATMPSGAPPRW